MKSRLSRLNSSKTALGIVSLFLAVLLWTYVGNIKILQIEKEFPVSYDLPPDTTFYELPPQSLMVEVKGPSLFLRRIDLNRQTLQLKLPPHRVKEKMTFNTKVDDLFIPLPLGVERLKVRPDVLELKIDRKISKKVPIVLSKQGELLSFLQLSKSNLIPSMVTIEGPISRLRELTAIKTNPVEMQKLAGSGFVDLELASTHPTVHYSIDRVRFDYEVEKKTRMVIFKKFPISFVGGKIRQRVNHRYVDIELKVEEQGFDRARLRKEIEVFADVSHLEKGNQWINLQIEAPEEIELIKLIPNKIKIRK